MVRFIIYIAYDEIVFSKKFTFQYGQIYYKERLGNCLKNIKDLHSNMVRFIIPMESTITKMESKFTFQYGQIYYDMFKKYIMKLQYIYIPIWLDLLCLIL